jgi:hypothetical protein
MKQFIKQHPILEGIQEARGDYEIRNTKKLMDQGLLKADHVPKYLSRFDWMVTEITDAKSYMLEHKYKSVLLALEECKSMIDRMVAEVEFAQAQQEEDEYVPDPDDY